MLSKRILVLVSLLLISFLMVGCFTTPAINQPPVIDTTKLPDATVGIDYTFKIIATDPNGDALTYSLTGFPDGMVIDKDSGVITWKHPIEGTFGVTVVVSDGILNDTEGFIIAVTDRTPMTITVDSPKFEVGIPTRFTVNMEANDDSGRKVVASFGWPISEEIGKIEGTLEMGEGSDVAFALVGDVFQTYPFTIVGNVTANFRGTFDKAGIYTTTITVRTFTGGDLLCSEKIKIVVEELVIADIDTEGRPDLLGTIKTDGSSIIFNIRAIGQANDGDDFNPSKYSQSNLDNEYFAIYANGICDLWDNSTGELLKYNMYGGNTTPYWGPGWSDNNSLPAGVTFSQTQDGDDFIYAVSMSYTALGISAGDTFSVQIKARDFNDDFVQSYDGYVGFDGLYSFYTGLWITDTGAFTVTLP